MDTRKKVKPLVIDNWKLSPIIVHPHAVELASLYGSVIGHPVLGDTNLTTSGIINIRGRIVTTHTRKYKLGSMDPVMLPIYAKLGITFDPKCPLKMKKRDRRKK